MYIGGCRSTHIVPDFVPPRLPARRACSSERGATWVITVLSRVKVFRPRRIRCQQPNSARCVAVDHELDFLLPVYLRAMAR